MRYQHFHSSYIRNPQVRTSGIYRGLLVYIHGVYHLLVDQRNDPDPTIKTKKAGDDTSDEEKEWLTALEKGELDDYGEVSKGKKKDPLLMTARQVCVCLVCSSAHCLFCSSSLLLIVSSAHRLFCSSSLLLIVSSAHGLFGSLSLG